MPRALAIGLLVAVLAARARAAELEDVHPDERETIRELGEALANFSVDGDGHVDGLTATPGARLDRAQLARIASLPHLRRLSLGWSEVADADLVELRKLTQLRRLVLPPDAGDRGIANLADLVLLEELFLTHSNLSDEGLGALAKLKQLAYLGLAATDITDAGIPRLLGLQRLREVDLRCTRVGDEGILVLAALENLSVLEVDASLVSADGAKALREKLPQLRVVPEALVARAQVEAVRALRLAGGQVELDADGRAIEAELTPTRDDAKLRAQFAAIPGLPTLVELDVTGVELSGATLASLLPPTGKLQKLRVKDPNEIFGYLMAELVGRQKRDVPAALELLSLAALDEQGNIEHLWLRHPIVSDETLVYLKMVPGVDEANLTDCDITDAGLPQLADWKNLRSLGLAGTAITDRGLKHLTDLPALERLDLAHTAVTDAGLRLLPDKSLKMLWLDQTAVTDDGVVELVKRIPLESLSLKYTSVSAETADRLRQARPSLDIQPDELPAAAIVPFVATVQRPGVLLDYDKEHQLIGVYFHESEPTDEDLEQLAKIPSIKLLSLQDQRISDEGFAALTQLTNLETLGLRGTPLTNGLARNLARLEKLTWLDLASTELGDAGLEHITRLARLEWLSLEGTAITDAAVERLAKLPRLEGLVVAGTKLTPAGIERLRRALPNCQINSTPPDETR